MTLDRVMLSIKLSVMSIMTMFKLLARKLRATNAIADTTLETRRGLINPCIRIDIENNPALLLAAAKKVA